VGRRRRDEIIRRFMDVLEEDFFEFRGL
jgi:hypothetical protein